MSDHDYVESTGEYKNSRKNEYTYDANNNIIFWARYLWASFTDMNYEWIKTSDNSYVYDSNNQETERLTRILFQNIITYEYEMTNSRKLINVWDANGNKTEYHYIRWDRSTSTWKDPVKTFYTYDSNNNNVGWVKVATDGTNIEKKYVYLSEYFRNGG